MFMHEHVRSPAGTGLCPLIAWQPSTSVISLQRCGARLKRLQNVHDRKNALGVHTKRCKTNHMYTVTQFCPAHVVVRCYSRTSSDLWGLPGRSDMAFSDRPQQLIQDKTYTAFSSCGTALAP